MFHQSLGVNGATPFPPGVWWSTKKGLID